MAGKKHTPTDKTRAQVEALAAFGIQQPHIAEMIGVHPNTLAKHYGRELEIGLSRANAKVASRLFHWATSADVDGKAQITAAIFWLKTRAGYREQMDVNASAKISFEESAHAFDETMARVASSFAAKGAAGDADD